MDIVKVLSEALSQAQNFLSEHFNNLRSVQIDTDWKFYTLLAVIGIIATWFFSIVIPRRDREKQRQEEIERYINRRYYASPPPLPEKPPEQLRQEKLQFFLSRSLKRENVFSYREFFVEREILKCPELCITQFSMHAKLQRNSHSHVNIYGDRGQGKTLILAALFLKHSKTKGVRLWMKSPESPADEDADYLAQYLKTPKIKRQKFVALFIDDYSHWNDSSEAKIRKRNIIEATLAETPFQQTRIIYTVSDQCVSHADKNLLLFLTETEEKSFLRKIALETPVLVGPSYTDINYALGLLGGKRQYSCDLKSFLSLIVEKLFQADSFSLPESLSSAHFRNDHATWQAIQLIAACSLAGINTELPAKLLEKSHPTARIHDLENITERQIVQIHNIGFITAPYYASRILMVETVNEAQLEAMYSQVFKACIQNGVSKKNETSFDFVQQVLYRLAKGRHFTFLEEGKSGTEIAQTIYLDIRAEIIEHCRSCENISTLCSWAAATARLNLIDDTQFLCEQLLSLNHSDLLLSGKDFVNFARTQRALLSLKRTTTENAQSDIREVIDSSLNILESSFNFALQNESQDQDQLAPIKEAKSRRLNEIVEVYLEVLLRARKLNHAKWIINELNLENGDGFDSLTLRVGARVLASSDVSAAKSMFRKALKEAEQEYSIRKAPDNLATVIFSYVKFLNDQHDPNNDEEMMARFTDMLKLMKKWPLGWSGEKQAEICKKYIIYLTQQCQYKVLKKYSSCLQGLVLPVLQNASEHGNEVIKSVEELLIHAQKKRIHGSGRITELLGEEIKKWQRRIAGL